MVRLQLKVTRKKCLPCTGFVFVFATNETGNSPFPDIPWQEAGIVVPASLFLFPDWRIRIMTNSLLIILAHGSRDSSCRESIEDFTELVSSDLGGDSVALAYMEFCPPSLEEVALQAWSAGITHIRVMPLFLSRGTHVRRDIPAQLDTVRERLPDMKVELLPAIGENPRMLRLMRDIAREEGLKLKLAMQRIGDTVGV